MKRQKYRCFKITNNNKLEKQQKSMLVASTYLMKTFYIPEVVENVERKMRNDER